MTETHLRADAQRNLDRLLEAAGECFAERGVEVSVDEIARRAGVGHGTVFRRFPTKEALLRAVVLRRLEELAGAAEAACEAEDVEAAFAGFVRFAAETYARDRGLVDGLDRCVGTPEIARLLAAAGRLVDRAQDAGAVRRDVSAEDVLRLVPTASRYPEIVLDGLRPPKSELSTT
ncbi:MAG TPA: helix-turn-helix domain-containing protein [Gaiellaceae bacterium]